MRLLRSIVLCSVLGVTHANRPVRYENSTQDKCGETTCDKGCNIDYKKGKMSYFFDFDGTLELHDKLAEDVLEMGELNQGCNPDTNFEMMRKALDDIKTRLGGTAEGFLKEYFIEDKDKDRVAQLRKQFQKLKDDGERVWILSASWRKVPGSVWQEYIQYLTGNHKDYPNGGFGLDLPVSKFDDGSFAILGIDDIGGNSKADKGRSMMNHGKCGTYNCVHVDNSIAYVVQAISHGHGGLYVKTHESLRNGTFEYLTQTSPTCDAPGEYDEGQAWKDGKWEDPKQPDTMPCSETKK